MNGYGYQPKMRCNSCTKKNDCKKYKDGKEACKKYEGVQPKPPTTWTPPSFRKPIPAPAPNPTKQRTVLSVRDFAILYHMANHEIIKMENQVQNDWMWGRNNYTEEQIEKEKAERMERLRQNIYYQDLLRIREKLGELNIEVETPSVEVEDD